MNIYAKVLPICWCCASLWGFNRPVSATSRGPTTDKGCQMKFWQLLLSLYFWKNSNTWLCNICIYICTTYGKTIPKEGFYFCEHKLGSRKHPGQWNLYRTDVFSFCQVLCSSTFRVYTMTFLFHLLWYLRPVIVNASFRIQWTGSPAEWFVDLTCLKVTLSGRKRICDTS